MKPNSDQNFIEAWVEHYKTWIDRWIERLIAQLLMSVSNLEAAARQLAIIRILSIKQDLLSTLKLRFWQVLSWRANHKELSCLSSFSRIQDSPRKKIFISTVSLKWRQLWEEFLQSSGMFTPPGNQKLIEVAFLKCLQY